MDHEVAFERLIKSFRNPAVLFSGGLDSSIIAFLAVEPNLYTLCDTEQSYDFINAKRGAELLGLDFEPVFFTADDVREALCYSKNSLDVAHYLLARDIKENKVLSGQGADELFLGYTKYARMNADEKVNKAREDFERWVLERREKKIFARFGKEIIFPYVLLEDLAFSLPLEEREEKRFLRSLAIRLGLPEEIALQKKKALQYGSGIDRVVKRLSASSSRSSRS